MRKQMIRKFRKNIMKLGKITKVEVLNRDDDGNKYPKKEWGYFVEAIVNGWKICSPDRNWYESYKACADMARYAMEYEPGCWDPETNTRKE